MSAITQVPNHPATDASAWETADFASPEDYSVKLTAGNLDELDSALRAVKAHGLSLTEITRDNFPLPGMTASIRRWCDELGQGRGFFVLDRLPVERYSVEEIEMIYWGIGTHMGKAVSQSVMGDMIGRVMDHSREDPHARAYRNRQALVPHTDFASVVGLLCIRPGRDGGETLLTSAASINNVMLEETPEQLERLYHGYYRHRRGEQGPDEKEYTEQKTPVLWSVDGRIGCHYTRPYVVNGQIAAGEPLDAFALAALDTFDRVASRDDLQLRFTIQAGQAVFMSNYSVLHGRTAFEDHDEIERRRLLLRLWLLCPGLQPLPDCSLDSHEGITPQPGRKPTFDWGAVNASKPGENAVN
ncbi:TauD/TfdA family dioxygenase [Thiothrix nivea]|uniref:Taurine catabolism dioxygenase TauD/TfdA n=1 Tax=Thiothrix nivea (strain ATCC 35100 / DSM 5205 / JP2) TaxID=870187 RepID=A0A656HIP5_THINJ|nr:TauD/TfdA family dioxygenase [Thiothrix nivea]EIJ36798.1 Taurine catabolism dioxygenase TauD/TfdA [Thiothrix nivea DSM 5205]